MFKKRFFLKQFFFIVFIFLYPSFIYGIEEYSIPQKTLTNMEKKYGAAAKKRVQYLISLMNKLKDKSEAKKIIGVNKFFNQVFYQTDLKNWNENDYWATRMEFLGKSSGDCEDYAIAKYFTLKQLGVEEDKLFMTYVKLIKLNQAHMVITYYPKPTSVPFILDNYNIKILPATKRPDLVPAYSFNGSSLYIAKQQGLGRAAPKAKKKNIKWSKLLDDIKRNKL